MIISVSRRTDIPAFYSDWFFKRLEEGYVLVRNPINAHLVSKLALNPNVVDAFVFWTKDPSNMLDKLELLKGYNYFFQFTLNPYDQELEPKVSRKSKVIDGFKRLSEQIGSRRVIWRYDPILLTDKVDIEYHAKYFEVLADKLCGCADKCTISFLDFYRNTEKNMMHLGIRDIKDEEKFELAEKIAHIAAIYGIQLQACAEKIDLSEQGIKKAKCIDPELIEEITGGKVTAKKDSNQREACGCIASIDIGAYDTCAHHCLYCYANHNKKLVQNNLSKYDVTSPLLCSKITDLDKVSERKMISCLTPLPGLLL